VDCRSEAVVNAAASAFAPDPYRGGGRNPLAHIRAQRAPVISPAGHRQAITIDPEGFPNT